MEIQKRIVGGKARAGDEDRYNELDEKLKGYRKHQEKMNKKKKREEPA